MPRLAEKPRYLDLDTLRIPVENARTVAVRFSPLPRAGEFRPDKWPTHRLAADGDLYSLDVPKLKLADGAYEYEFVIERQDGTRLVLPDPYAEEITRFGGYRGVFHIHQGRRVRPAFDWSNELPRGVDLPQHNEMVIYELPMRWVDTPSDAGRRHVGLGTFDKALHERLDYLVELGINAIELLPVQDSPDTLNWGYGTRFFFAPDLDMGEPFDLKLFVKRCHQKGIMVILDVVMNHSRACPLEQMAPGRYYLQNGWEEPIPTRDGGRPRPSWGGAIFRYADGVDGEHPAREFHFEMARFWIEEYHVDGFRVDEFMGINNWDFITEFTARAREAHRRKFPDRPFVVIAEDSWNRPQITRPGQDGRPVVNSCWDFGFRHHLRQLVVGNREHLTPTEARQLLGGSPLYSELEQRIVFCTSHDVQGYLEKRLLPLFLDRTLGEPDAPLRALELVHSAFALMMTAVGVPMFLAGEEFGDLHDTDHGDDRQKMSDPINWERSRADGHAQLAARVRQLVRLRTGHPALQNKAIDFFGLENGFHPTFGLARGEHVFTYCRTDGQPIGSPDQVVVVANCTPRHYQQFWLPWRWTGLTPEEHGGHPHQALPHVEGAQANLELYPYQVRVFTT